jgi:hypothetical protein
VAGQKPGVDARAGSTHLANVVVKAGSYEPIGFEKEPQETRRVSDAAIGSAADSTISANDRRDALSQLWGHGRACDQRGIVMCMNVDKPRGDHEPAHIDLTRSGHRANPADTDDLTLSNGYITEKSATPSTVDDGTVSQHQVTSTLVQLRHGRAAQ